MADIDPKKSAAQKAVTFIQSGMTVGLGTGSTAYWAIRLIGEMVKEGMAIKAVCTSVATEKLAHEFSIPVAAFSAIEHIDLTIDGADEIDHRKNLIKGGGGALLREKIVAFNSRQFIVIADESKVVKELGRFPLPVEVLPFGVELTQQHLAALCSQAEIRMENAKPYRTDNGNYIIDCHLGSISDPIALNLQLKNIPGVLETGIFLNRISSTVIIGYRDGRTAII
ncbi:MAG TPA: ribose-5-phosphate isomerase RpiA [Flavisolibacter sp.]|jgi:ribose 5-phosphate isomerase A|nr:ribose-5-phosphate isomerase RpiA [Flavisolibacter sp.]